MNRSPNSLAAQLASVEADYQAGRLSPRQLVHYEAIRRRIAAAERKLGIRRT